jgi:hypothetical protein
MNHYFRSSRGKFDYAYNLNRNDEMRFIMKDTIARSVWEENN